MMLKGLVGLLLFQVLIAFAAEKIQDQPEDRGKRLTKKKVLKKINKALKKAGVEGKLEDLLNDANGLKPEVEKNTVDIQKNKLDIKGLQIDVENLKPITNSTDPITNSTNAPTIPPTNTTLPAPTTTLPSVDPCQDPSIIDNYIAQNSITPFGSEIAVLDGTCYIMPGTKRNWNDALDMCKAWGGDLYHPRSLSENIQISTMFEGATKTEYDYSFFIGINDIDVENEWKNSDGSELTFENWYTDGSQPDNANGGQDCAANELNYHAWYDMDCADEKAFLCEFR